MGEVVFPHITTTLPVPVERVLDGARDCTEVLVIGWDKDGKLFLAASHGDLGDHLILLERAKAVLLEQVNG